MCVNSDRKEYTNPFDKDIIECEGGMRQCISGFGRNALLAADDFSKNRSNETFNAIKYHIDELVRWCQELHAELHSAKQLATNQSATAFVTERFVVSHVNCERNEAAGFDGRDVYVAFFHDQDVPQPVCVVTLEDKWVEWIEVRADYRRQGIATEVLTGLESHVGSLELTGATDEGEAFLDAFCQEDAS